MPSPAISVVVLSHDRRSDLISNVLPLLAGMEHGNWELIVVDNASSDGTIDALEDLSKSPPKLQVILSSENLGVAMGRNTGYRLAIGPAECST